MNDLRRSQSIPPFDPSDGESGVHALVPKLFFFGLCDFSVYLQAIPPKTNWLPYIALATASIALWFTRPIPGNPRTVPVVTILACSIAAMNLVFTSTSRNFVQVPILGASLLAIAACLGELLHRRSPRAALWLYAAAVLGGTLGIASSDAGQASPMVAWFIDTFGFSKTNAEFATISVRKSIHFTYFGLIAGLAWGGAIRLSGDVRRSAMFALLWTASFAAFDELNQLQFTSRSGSGWDFLIDMAGASAFVSFAVWRRRGTEKV